MTTHQQQFNNACKNGNIQKAKTLYKIRQDDETPIDIHAGDEEAFRWSCGNGHFKIAKWLYHLGQQPDETPIDIHARNDFAFCLGCGNGHFEIPTDDNIFGWSCIHGHSKIAKWLIRMGNIPSRDNHKVRKMYQYFVKHIKKYTLQHNRNTEKLKMVWCHCSRVDIR